MKCACSQHQAIMWHIFEGVMPRNQVLVLEHLVPSRSKKIGKGKCAWSISVASTIHPVTTKAEYNVVKGFVLSNSPMNGVLAMSGRYAERGICATYVNASCQCTLDFRSTPTLFRGKVKFLYFSVFFRVHWLVDIVLSTNSLQNFFLYSIEMGTLHPKNFLVQIFL